ncbi:MAG: hypothetical protein AAFR11_00975 [Pseudomonadota bacterium]
MTVEGDNKPEGETDWFGRLNETERTAVVIGGVFVALVVLLIVGVSLTQALLAVRAG